MKENTTRLVIVLIVSAVLMVFHINFLSDKHIEINIVNDKPAAQTIDQPKVEQPKVEQPKPTTIVQPAVDDVKILVQSNQKAEEAKRLLSKSKSEDAIKLCNEALELNPNNPVAYMMRGYGYQQLGDLKRAIVEYNRAIELDPNYALAYFNRGVAFEHLYNREQAVID
ncbi:MAG: tetratricopeptide repeat protein, partial [Selenomonadaceae bacterium]|nr:tetratricopeptide repeat protein [Selenomonadaceae bacterium]